MAALLNQSFQNAKSENRPALLTYTVAGDNTKKRSLEIVKSISNYADICELGFPHNTPIADGGQIQTSAYRAIKNGIKINDVFSIAKDFKKSKKTKPIALLVARNHALLRRIRVCYLSGYRALEANGGDGARCLDIGKPA